MWNSFTLAHQESEKVKETKIGMLIRKYKMFKMEERETNDYMFGRFQTITINLNHLERLVILRSLPKQWSL